MDVSKRYKYIVFVEALVLTVVFFSLGLYVGGSLEESRIYNINNKTINSEVNLIDVLALNKIKTDTKQSCDFLIKGNYNFMNKVYEQAIELEDYVNTGYLIDDIKLFHRKYDVQRLYLWLNILEIKEKCNFENYDYIVYLYDRETQNKDVQGKQNTLSRILFDVKLDNENLFLIPISKNTDLVSLNTIIANKNITSFPSLIINGEVIQDLISENQIREILQDS